MNKSPIRTNFPVFAMVLAIAAAFGFKTSANDRTLLNSGHKKVGTNCVDSGIMCTSEPTGFFCRDASFTTLYKYYGATNCPVQLWRPEP